MVMFASSMLFFAHKKPMWGKDCNWLGVFNRATLLVCCYHLVAFTDFVEREAQYYVGFSFLITVLTFIIVNMLYFVLDLMKIIKNYLVKYGCFEPFGYCYILIKGLWGLWALLNGYLSYFAAVLSAWLASFKAFNSCEAWLIRLGFKVLNPILEQDMETEAVAIFGETKVVKLEESNIPVRESPPPLQKKKMIKITPLKAIKEELVESSRRETKP